ncbi:MAG: alpha-L-fucosidase [Bacteroidales bacterium]|nr:alpha-L-fucosidase [Bacteroidales bacterium]
MKYPHILLSLLMILLTASACTVRPPVPFGACPTPQQVAWQQMEMNLFCHFGPNTFTGAEWGDGTEPEDIFQPTDLDCRQWAETARAAGFRGVILTAKHHDGFCLWPSPESAHTVAQSAWRDGQGDVLRALSDACAAEDLRFGVYISPWDRNDPRYGSPAYNEAFVRTLESVLDGRYGPVFEQWFDGACGEGPTGRRQVYDWPLFNATVERLQPQAVIFSDVGPGCRWVGNERGEAGRTNWSTLELDGFEPGAGSPPVDVLNGGTPGASHWAAAETDVSIRPGWFWRASETAQVKGVQELLQIYYESVGRNSLLLLNVPPDTRGRIDAVDSLRLMEFRAALDAVFAVDQADGAAVSGPSRGRGFAPANVLSGDYDSYWALPDDRTTASLTLEFPEPRTFNRLLLQEYIPLGQRIVAFHAEMLTPEGFWLEIARETTVGYKRIVLTPTVTTSALRLVIDDALACPTLTRLALYHDTVYCDSQ